MTTCKAHEDSPDPECQLCSRALAEFWLDVWGWEHTEDTDAWSFQDAADEFIYRTLGCTWEDDFETEEDIILNPHLIKLYAFKAWDWAEEQGARGQMNYPYFYFSGLPRGLVGKEFSIVRYGKVTAIMRAAAEVPERKEK